MTDSIDYDRIQAYFLEKLQVHGATPRGVDWNSESSQEIRFAQLAKIVTRPQDYSLLDYGSGFGSFYDYLRAAGHTPTYLGYDLVAEMAAEGTRLHAQDPACRFTAREEDLQTCDYAVASGIFNIRMDVPVGAWTSYVIDILRKMDGLSKKGFAFNFLTSYSDADRMRPDLYYADPCFYFDYCKRNFSKNVAILHDYTLYDFTVLVRKEI